MKLRGHFFQQSIGIGEFMKLFQLSLIHKLNFSADKKFWKFVSCLDGHCLQIILFMSKQVGSWISQVKEESLFFNGIKEQLDKAMALQLKIFCPGEVY